MIPRTHRESVKRGLLAATIAVALGIPAVSLAYSVQYLQYGVVSYSVTPAYTVSNYGTECRYGSCTEFSGSYIDYAWSGQQACEYAIARSGIPESSDITCAHEKYTTGGSFGSGYYGSGGGDPGGGSLTVPQAYASVFVGHSVPKESACVQPTASSCGIYTHTAPVATPPPPVPTASLSASPGTIAYGGSSALTHYCTDSTSASISYVGGVSASSGTTSVAPGSATTYTLTCSGAGGTAYAYATVNVIYYPNLYSVTGSTITVTAGQTATLTGTTYNNGDTTASGSFYDLFLIYDSGYNYSYANGSTYWAHTDPVWSGAIGSSSYLSRAGYYTFNTPGTYYYRLCADWNGGVSEKNEGDNCGGLVQVNVVAPIPPPPTGLYHICNAGGTQVTLYWNASPGAVDYYVRLYDGISANPYTGYAGYNDYYPGTSITYNIVPGRYHDWWVHSRNGTGYSAPSYGSFTCVGYPDLVAGGVSASQTIPNRSTTLSAVATNSSGGSSGGFPMLFQIADGAITYTIGYAQSGYASLSPGQSTTMSGSYTFPAGTYGVRACANYNTSWQAITSESNYGNNCGPWSVITFQNTGSLSCTVPSDTAKVGDTVTYSAGPSNGAGAPYSWDDSQGGSYGSGSTASRTFTALGNYSMNVAADNTIQSSYSCLTPNGSTFITVGCAAPHTASITAAASRIRQGQSTTLTWSGAGINNSCVLSGPNVSQTAPANSCVVGPQTTSTGALSTQSRYCVTCDGSVQQCTTVNVVPLFEEF